MTKVILQMQENNPVVDESVARLKRATGATVLKLSEVAKIGKLKKGDTLILLAHGNPSTLGKKTPSQIAEILAKADLKSGVVIDLVACNSGKGGSPLALELKTQLVNSHKIVPGSVSGGKGYMAVLSAGAVAGNIEQTGTDAKGNATYARARTGKVKEQTPFGERTRNVQEEFRTT